VRIIAYLETESFVIAGNGEVVAFHGRITGREGDLFKKQINNLHHFVISDRGTREKSFSLCKARHYACPLCKSNTIFRRYASLEMTTFV
jgi:hypothetical protein